MAAGPWGVARMAMDRRASPWPVVIATTLRLWLGRRGKMLGRLSRRHWALLVLAGAFLVAGLAVSFRVSAGGSALPARHEVTQGDRVAGAPDQKAAVVRAAALWVTRQVSRGAM